MYGPYGQLVEFCPANCTKDCFYNRSDLEARVVATALLKYGIKCNQADNSDKTYPHGLVITVHNPDPILIN